MDKILVDGKGKYTVPVIHNIKNEPKSPENGEASGETGEGSEEGETQKSTSNQNSPEKQSPRKEKSSNGPVSTKPDASSSSQVDDEEIKIEILSDKVTRTAVKSILPSSGDGGEEEDMDEDVKITSPDSTDLSGRQASNKDNIPASTDSHENGGEQGKKSLWMKFSSMLNGFISDFFDLWFLFLDMKFLSCLLIYCVDIVKLCTR